MMKPLLNQVSASKSSRHLAKIDYSNRWKDGECQHIMNWGYMLIDQVSFMEGPSDLRMSEAL
jgi:hypothetical protein